MTAPVDTKVRSCGRAYDTSEPMEAMSPADICRIQLNYWAGKSVRYVGLFITEDAVTLASSEDDPAQVLALATYLHNRASVHSARALAEDLGFDGVAMEEELDEDEDDE